MLFACILGYGNRIDLLKTTEDVIGFVKEVHPDFNTPRFTIRSTQQMAQDLYCDGVFKEWDVKNWEKADLTHNGKTDLIFTAYFNGYKPYVIIDSDNGSYQLLPLHIPGSPNQCILSKPIKIKEKSYIKYYHQAQVVDRENKNRISYKTISVIDTLTIKDGGLFELNEAVPQYNIEKITLQTMPCFGVCPVFDFSMDKMGNASFKGEANVPKIGDYTTRFHQQTVKELFEMIEYAQVKELENAYENSWSDGQTVTLHIDFSDGTTKTIRDYGLQGTFSLNSIYSKLIKLGTETDWN